MADHGEDYGEGVGGVGGERDVEDWGGVYYRAGREEGELVLSGNWSFLLVLDLEWEKWRGVRR